MTREQINMDTGHHANLLMSGAKQEQILTDSTLAHRQQQQQIYQTIPKSIMTSANESPLKASHQQDDDQQTVESTIAILRRNPMYDCLVLVKRYRPQAKGFTLEFPSSTSSLPNNNNNNNNNNKAPNSTTVIQSNDNQTHFRQKSDSKSENKSSGCKSKLRSVYLDSDDPIYLSMDQDGSRILSQDGDLVYVPMNGLIERLDKFEQLGLMIDTRVYAFAMGIKTAEKFLTTNSVKELHETPQL